MCSNKSLCHLFVALNVLAAVVLVRGHNNSTFYYTRFGRQDDEVHMERMLRDIFGGMTTASKRESRFIHYDLSDNAVNLGMEFTVPFLSIPVKKTIDSTMGFLQVIPKTMINFNALFIGILLAVVAVAANGLLDANSQHWPPSVRSIMKSMMMMDEDADANGGV